MPPKSGVGAMVPFNSVAGASKLKRRRTDPRHVRPTGAPAPIRRGKEAVKPLLAFEESFKDYLETGGDKNWKAILKRMSSADKKAAISTKDRLSREHDVKKIKEDRESILNQLEKDVLASASFNDALYEFWTFWNKYFFDHVASTTKHKWVFRPDMQNGAMFNELMNKRLDVYLFMLMFTGHSCNILKLRTESDNCGAGAGAGAGSTLSDMKKWSTQYLNGVDEEMHDCICHAQDIFCKWFLDLKSSARVLVMKVLYNILSIDLKQGIQVKTLKSRNAEVRISDTCFAQVFVKSFCRTELSVKFEERTSSGCLMSTTLKGSVHDHEFIDRVLTKIFPDGPTLDAKKDIYKRVNVHEWDHTKVQSLLSPFDRATPITTTVAVAPAATQNEFDLTDV